MPHYGNVGVLQINAVRELLGRPLYTRNSIKLPSVKHDFTHASLPKHCNRFCLSISRQPQSMYIWNREPDAFTRQHEQECRTCTPYSHVHLACNPPPSTGYVACDKDLVPSVLVKIDDLCPAHVVARMERGKSTSARAVKNLD